MNSEIQSMLSAFELSQHQGKAAFLATVVRTQGSTYRRSGARLFMTDDGQTIGMVSGGCLERDIFEHTQQRMLTGEPIVITYDHTAPEDILWGFGLGCNGVVDVLIEPLHPPDDPLTFFARCWRDRTPGVLASLIQVEGDLTPLGACLMLTSDLTTVLDQAEPELVDMIGSDAQIVLQNQQSIVKQYKLATRQVQIFFEFVQPPIHLMLFGAGQDAILVTQYAKSLGWFVTVVDCRANIVSYERFDQSDRVILTHREKLDDIEIERESVAVVMTHNYYDDLETLRLLLPTSIQYIGLLGSRQRTQQLLKDLQQDYTEAQLVKLYTPVGLDIGAETPHAIALSILAEIQSVLSDRTGGSLKYRQGAIHDSCQNCLTTLGGRRFNSDGITQTVTSHSMA
jgi:xanthine dehydrogenase accessory factor